MSGIADISLVDLILVALAALIGSFFSSLTGTGGAIVLSLVLPSIIGLSALVPVLSVALTINNVMRIGAFRKDVDRRVGGLILLGAVPGTIVGALVLVRLDEAAIALVLGFFLIGIVIARRLLAHRSFSMPAPVVVVLSAAYGVLAGLTVGGGILVLPLLAAAGLAGARLVGTDALIGLVVHITKVVVFGAAAALTAGLFVTGIVIGILMAPGAFLARAALEAHAAARPSMADRRRDPPRGREFPLAGPALTKRAPTPTLPFGAGLARLSAPLFGRRSSTDRSRAVAPRSP